MTMTVITDTNGGLAEVPATRDIRAPHPAWPSRTWCCLSLGDGGRSLPPVARANTALARQLAPPSAFGSMGNLVRPLGHYLVVAAPSMASHLTDAHLVESARAGDRQAMGLLLDRHRPLVVRLCRRLLGSPELAEDAAQEACLQAFLGLERLRDGSRFGPWLAGIGLNVARHWLRDSVEELSDPAITGGWAGREMESPDPGPEALAVSADIARRVRVAVAGLAPGQRGAVVGFYLCGLTHRETAAALGIGAPSVKARLHKGRAALRARLRTLREDDMNDVVEMRVVDVRRGAHDAEPAAHLVVLEEIDGIRRLPIWIGPPEAMSLAFLLEKVDLPRPLAPQFMHNTLRAIGARLLEVRIDRLAARTFYAVAVVEGPSGRVEIDARPSDALNLAVLAGARVTARRELLEVAADQPETTLGQFTDEKFPESAGDMVMAHLEATEFHRVAAPPEHP